MVTRIHIPRLVDYYLAQTHTSYVDLLLIHWPTSGKNSSDPICQPGSKTYDAKACSARAALSFRILD
jgi:diketogulonate reductase-like aldo/keto reductase